MAPQYELHIAYRDGEQAAKKGIRDPYKFAQLEDQRVLLHHIEGHLVLNARLWKEYSNDLYIQCNGTTHYKYDCDDPEFMRHSSSLHYSMAPPGVAAIKEPFIQAAKLPGFQIDDSDETGVRRHLHKIKTYVDPDDNSSNWKCVTFKLDFERGHDVYTDVEYRLCILKRVAGKHRLVPVDDYTLNLTYVFQSSYIVPKPDPTGRCGSFTTCMNGIEMSVPGPAAGGHFIPNYGVEDPESLLANLDEEQKELSEERTSFYRIKTKTKPGDLGLQIAVEKVEDPRTKPLEDKTEKTTAKSGGKAEESDEKMETDKVEDAATKPKEAKAEKPTVKSGGKAEETDKKIEAAKVEDTKTNPKEAKAAKTTVKSGKKKTEEAANKPDDEKAEADQASPPKKSNITILQRPKD